MKFRLPPLFPVGLAPDALPPLPAVKFMLDALPAVLETPEPDTVEPLPPIKEISEALPPTFAVPPIVDDRLFALETINLMKPEFPTVPV